MNPLLVKLRHWVGTAKNLTLDQMQRWIDGGSRRPLDLVGGAGRVMPGVVRLAPVAPFPVVGAGVTGTLSEAAEGRSVAPRLLWGPPVAVVSTQLDAIKYAVISNARVQANTTPVVTDVGVHVQEDVRRELSSWRFRNQYIALHDAERAIVITRRLRFLPKGLFLGGHGASNWYHWLIELLPKAMLARRLPHGLADWPLLVPDHVIQNPTFRASLEAIAPGAEVIGLDSAAVYQVGELIWIDTPAVSPFNMVDGVWPKPEDYRQHPHVLSAVRNAILGKAKSVDAPTPERLFLMRDVRTRPYNQDEMVALASAHGFTPVYPERHSFMDQVRMFNQAEAIVGASGAAWANLLFARHNMVGLCWTFSQYAGASMFSDLADLSGASLAYLFVPSEVRSTHDLYRSPYVLPVAEFNSALVRLLETDGIASDASSRPEIFDRTQSS